jgi:hypothetical protein
MGGTVPDAKTNRFFVMPQLLVNDQIAKGIQEARTRAVAKGKSGEKAACFRAYRGNLWSHMRTSGDCFPI